MFVNLEIKNYHHGTSYATRHTCVTRTVTLDGLRHLLWLLLMWRSNLKKSTACCLPTRLLNMQSHGWTRRIWGFSRKERRRHPSSQVSPPIWNAGAWPGIPHAGFTQEHSVPSVGHKQPASHCWGFPTPHINANYLLLKTIKTFSCFAG